MSDNDIFPIEQMSNEEDKKITFSNLNKQILHNANLEVSVDEENATLTVDLKDEKGEIISTKTVDLPNTGNIDCEVDEDTAELTVQLKNTKGEVVTSDTVQLPNTSNIDCEVSEDMKLTVSLKNKSGQVVTSDTVQLQSAFVPSITQSEYDDLTEEEKTNGQIREITDAEGFPVPFAIMNDEMTTSANVLSAQETENRIENAEKNIYNFDEEVIIGFIIQNGVKKPIYRKVVAIGNFYERYDISIPNINEVINMSIKRRYDNRENMWVIGDGVTSANNIYFSYTETGIRVSTGSSSITIYSCTITLEYTKTTD